MEGGWGGLEDRGSPPLHDHFPEVVRLKRTGNPKIPKRHHKSKHPRKNQGSAPQIQLKALNFSRPICYLKADQYSVGWFYNPLPLPSGTGPKTTANSFYSACFLCEHLGWLSVGRTWTEVSLYPLYLTGASNGQQTIRTSFDGKIITLPFSENISRRPRSEKILQSTEDQNYKRGILFPISSFEKKEREISPSTALIGFSCRGPTIQHNRAAFRLSFT